MLYRTYHDYCMEVYGARVQKLPVDGGFGCPNRDGRTGAGGCTFCSNEAFSPAFAPAGASIGEQIEAALAFYGRRRGRGLYFAYFQSFSNTYGPVEVLRRRYEEALGHPQVSGLVVATRPDCIDAERIDLLAAMAERCPVEVEIGIESCCDATLRLVGRGHDYACSARAAEAAARRGLPCCGHLILGLPGESRRWMAEEAALLSALPLTGVKLHQLQVLRGSALERQWQEDGAAVPPPFGLEEYVGVVCDFLERLRPDMMVERLASEVPPRFQAAPERGWRHADGRRVRAEELGALVEEELHRRGTRQGCRWATPAPAAG